MSNISKRLIFFFVAFPALIILVVFLPQRHHLAFNLVSSVAVGAAALEVANIFRNRGVALSSLVCFLLSFLGPASSYLRISGMVEFSIYPLAAVVVMMILFSREIFKKSELEFKDVLFRLSGYAFVAVYPGFFGSYVVRLSAFPHAAAILLAFIAVTYLNDSTAWASGVLWGNGTRNILAVSPNKSLIGFLFGFLTSIAVMVAGRLIAPSAFPMSVAHAALMGAVLGATTILGDLAESALKRSAVVKDSGQIIPGRGGVLDSIDSPLFNAPVFFYLYWAVTSVGNS